MAEQLTEVGKGLDFGIQLRVLDLHLASAEALQEITASIPELSEEVIVDGEPGPLLERRKLLEGTGLGLGLDKSRIAVDIEGCLRLWRRFFLFVQPQRDQLIDLILLECQVRTLGRLDGHFVIESAGQVFGGIEFFVG